MSSAVPPQRPAVRTLGTIAAIITLLVVSGLALFDRRDSAQAHGGSGGSAPHVAAPSTSAAPDPSTSSGAKATSAAPAARAATAKKTPSVADAVNAIIAKQPAGAVSVAAVNAATGASFSAGATSGMWTASVYKLLVLEALLWQHEQSHAFLSGDETTEATAMIENSDNTAGYELFEAAGGTAGEAAAIKAFGMSHTSPGVSDPAFTTTSATDALILLRNLVSSHSPLDAASRSYALGLMSNVESDQRWGVGVVADPGSTVYNKNGWLAVDNENSPTEDDDGLWVASSVGIVKVHGQQILMAVFTRHQPDMGSGVRLVQQLARTIVPAVAR